MATLADFVKRYPVWAYFVLAFVISWGAVLIVIGGPSAIPGNTEQAERLLPLVVLVMFFGPSVSSLLLTVIVHGKTGLSDLLSRLVKWRMGIRWYAAALCIGPLLVLGTLLALSLTSPAYLPGFASGENQAMVFMSLAYGLGAGLFEELGWTGFAVPHMRMRYGIFTTGLIVGFLWGAWHFLTNFWGAGGPSGELALDNLVPGQLFAILTLPAYRVLMVWVYDRTSSLFAAMLMHASFTSSWLICMPVGISGEPFLVWYLVLSGTLWVVVAAVAVAGLRESTQALGA